MTRKTAAKTKPEAPPPLELELTEWELELMFHALNTWPPSKLRDGLMDKVEAVMKERDG